jgi:hypothetical protein
MSPFPSSLTLARLATLVGTAALASACSRGSDSGAAPLGTATPVAILDAAPAASSAPVDPDAMAPGGFVKANIDYVLNPQNLPAYAGPTGSVEGTVTIDGPPAPSVPVDASKCAAALDTYGKLFREGTPAKPGGPRPLADAVVVVVGYTGYYVPEKKDAVSVSVGVGCGYAARTLAITYGQRLEITNQSTFLFAPLIDSYSTPAVMVAPPKGSGEPIKIYPQRAGHFIMTDRLVSYVHEDLYVFRHPLHAVTDRNGHFRIDGVPVGSLKLGVAHPGANTQAEVPVDIKADTVSKTDVKVTYKPASSSAKPASSEVIPPWKLPNE